MARGGYGLPKVLVEPAFSPTLLRSAGGPPPLKRPYDCFYGGPPSGQAACGCPLPRLSSIGSKGPMPFEILIEQSDTSNVQKGKKPFHKRTISWDKTRWKLFTKVGTYLHMLSSRFVYVYPYLIMDSLSYETNSVPS
jgi:hypothetical protein